MLRPLTVLALTLVASGAFAQGGASDPLAVLDDATHAATRRLVATLARQAVPTATPEERAQRCRRVPALRVLRRLGDSPTARHALVAIHSVLERCSDGRSGDSAARMFEVRADARGRLVGRPVAEDDARLASSSYAEGTRLVASCAAYESDASIAPRALAFVRQSDIGFGACTARGLDDATIRREVATCLESRRAGDALVTFGTAGGDEACRVVVRTERIGGAAWTRVSSSSGGSGFSHAFARDGAAVCEAFGSLDAAGCARGTPARRATDLACPVAAEDARALASAPAFTCADREELRAMHVTHRASAPTAGFAMTPTLGLLARGRSNLPDAEVSAFVAEAVNRASTCPARGSAPAGRDVSTLLVTFSVGPQGVGAIATAAGASDQGLAACLAESIRATQNSLRLESQGGAPPVYQYTITVRRS